MGFTMNHWDGRAPIALAADQPIAITIVNRFFTNAFFLQPVNDLGNAGILSSLFGIDLGTVQHAGVDHGAGTNISCLANNRLTLTFGLDHWNNG